MRSYNVDYHVVIELLQILHKLGRGRSCDRSKRTNLSKELNCLLLHNYKPFCLEKQRFYKDVEKR